MQFLGCTGHISDAQQPHVVGGYHTGQCRYRILQKVLLDSADLDHKTSLNKFQITGIIQMFCGSKLDIRHQKQNNYYCLLSPFSQLQFHL